jgi:hypothetical protein
MKVEQFLTKVKPGTLAIIIIVIAVALYFLLKKSNTDQSQKAVDDLKVDESKISFSSDELNFKTSQLLDAMNQIGTDTTTIMNVLKSLNSGDDLLYIIKAFGVKPYYLTGLGDGLISRFMATDENLVGWFHSELSDSELADVKAEFDRLGVSML